MLCEKKYNIKIVDNKKNTIIHSLLIYTTAYSSINYSEFVTVVKLSFYYSKL